MRRLIPVAFVLGVLAAAGGCYADPAPGTRVSPVPSSPSSPSPLPSPPPPVSDADLRSWVERAQLRPDAVGAQPPKPVTEQSGNERYTGPCKAEIVANGYLAYAHKAYWIGTRIDTVHHHVYAFSALFGREAVAQVRRVVTGCSEYELTGPPAAGLGNSPTTVRLKVVPDLPLAVPAGTDAAYAYCEISTDITPGHPHGPVHICTALVSRRNLMMSVQVDQGTGTSPGVASAHQRLASVLAVAVAALVNAVPGG
jgi:hypothetical protein